MFARDQLSDDGFLDGKLRILQPRNGYRAATDPVFLAAAVPAKPGESVLDLGCGVGVASLCLAARVPNLALSGLERQPEYAALARENAARNSIELAVFEGDLEQVPAALRQAFAHVIANPPYLVPGDGTPAGDAGREAALREQTPLSAWIEAATRRLAPGGCLSMIHEVARLPALLSAIDRRLGSIILLPLASREGRPANRIILRARKGGRAPFRLLPPVILHDGEAHDADRDSFTPEIRAVLRDGGSLLARFG